jgi:hypothetical protein
LDKKGQLLSNKQYEIIRLNNGRKISEIFNSDIFTPLYLFLFNESYSGSRGLMIYSLKLNIKFSSAYRRVPFCGMSAVEELRILLK